MPETACNLPEPLTSPLRFGLTDSLRFAVACALELDAVDDLDRLDDDALVRCLVIDKAATFEEIAVHLLRGGEARAAHPAAGPHVEGVEHAPIAGADAHAPRPAPLPAERTPPADPDAKVVTQDGATWPKLRRAMTSREAQVARMVEDLETIARERPGAAITDEDLMRKGWTIGQVRDHGRVARDRFREARAAAGRADEEARS